MDICVALSFARTLGIERSMIQERIWFHLVGLIIYAAEVKQALIFDDFPFDLSRCSKVFLPPPKKTSAA